MKLIFPVAALLSCAFLFFYLPLFASYSNALDMDFEQYKLDKSLEMSTRAAAENGLTHGLVTFDREQLSDVEFNASVVLSTYAQFMCFNYNLVPTEQNREYVLGKSVLMAVGGRGFVVTQNEFGDYYTGNDGRLHRVSGAKNPGDPDNLQSATNSGARTLFGPYTPFTVADTNAPANITRLVSGSLLPNAVTFAVFERNHNTGAVSVYAADTLPGDVTSSRIQHEALALMTRAFTQSWNQLNMQAAYDKQLVLPNTITSLGVSSAANPGVMALVEGINFGSSKPLRSEAFTGYKAVMRREVVAFTQAVGANRYKWYCYRDQFDMAKAEAGGGEYSGVTVDYVYGDMNAAAEAGYKPHLGFLSK